MMNWFMYCSLRRFAFESSCQHKLKQLVHCNPKCSFTCRINSLDDLLSCINPFFFIAYLIILLLKFNILGYRIKIINHIISIIIPIVLFD